MTSRELGIFGEPNFQTRNHFIILDLFPFLFPVKEAGSEAGQVQQPQQGGLPVHLQAGGGGEERREQEEEEFWVSSCSQEEEEC